MMGALFPDRLDAGRRLAAALEHADLRDAVVVGLARGGVMVAAEIARRLSLPLDALAVRKIGYPFQPEYAIGAVTPGAGGVYLRSDEGLGESTLDRAIEQAQAKADALDRIIHEHCPRREVRGKTVVLVDDGLATGATMRLPSLGPESWCRAGCRRRASRGRAECEGSPSGGGRGRLPHQKRRFGAVGFWYEVFTQVENDEVIALLLEFQSAESAPAGRDRAD